MYKLRLLGAKEDDDGLVQIMVHERDGKPSVPRYYRAVRMAVSWPAVGVSAAIAVVGCVANVLAPARGALLHNPGGTVLELLAEHEHSELGLAPFFDAMAEFYELFCCESCYADLNDASCADPLRQFISEREYSIRVIDQVYRHNVFAQVANLKDKLQAGTLILHDSETRREASRLELNDVNDDMKKAFPLTAALSAVVCGFAAHPPSQPIQVPAVFALGGDGGWMAG